MLDTLKAFWRVLNTSDEDRTWFPHEDGKRLCRWNLQRHEYEFKPLTRERTPQSKGAAAFKEAKQ